MSWPPQALPRSLEPAPFSEESAQESEPNLTSRRTKKGKNQRTRDKPIHSAGRSVGESSSDVTQQDRTFTAPFGQKEYSTVDPGSSLFIEQEGQAEFAPNAGFDSDTSMADISAADIRQQETLEAEGRANAFQRQQGHMPTEVLRIWSKRYLFIRQFWNGGHKRSAAVKQLKQADDEVKALAPAHPEWARYAIGEDIKARIEVLVSGLEAYNTASNSGKQATGKKLSTDVLSFVKTADDYGLAWAQMSPRDSYKTLCQIVQKESPETLRDLETLLARPSFEHREELKQAIVPLKRLQKGVDSLNKQMCVSAIRDLGKINDRITEINKHADRPLTVHTIPDDKLRRIEQVVSSTALVSIPKTATPLLEELGAWFELGHSPASKAIRVNPSNQLSPEERRQALSHYTGVSLASESSGRAKLAFDEGAAQLFETEENLDFVWQEELIPPPVQENGVTKFGKVDFVYRYGSEKRSCYRLFVNYGTERMPLYKVMKGSDLGKGMGEVLFSDSALARANPDLKDRTAQSLQGIRRIAFLEKHIADHFEKKRLREWPIFFEVVWRSPLRAGAQTSEWVCRTDLERLFGKRYMSEVRERLTKQFKSNDALLARRKRDGKDPDNGTPLTKNDFETRPWLVDDDVRAAIMGTAPGGRDQDGVYNEFEHDMEL